uniref:centrosomal protein of 44 kDa isoform X2 n=1 Tax=Scatophagus argus TaxID=75038 RepID=UPI001ED804A4|nr:centrosomal protein of 44 kDa isoform X2 [Scatophagus argus]
MLSTGDVQGWLRKLETLLRMIKYPGCVDYKGLSIGDPSAFLPIVSFTLTSFSPPFAEQLMATGLEVTGKTDLRFTDTFYKVLRDIFHYKPILTKQQFLQWGFSQRKISVTCDIINLVLEKHNQLNKPRVRCPASHKDGIGAAHPMLTKADTVSVGLSVVNHSDNHSSFPKNTPHADAFSPDCSGNGTIELAEEEKNKDNILHSSEVEGRLSVLEAKLERLDVLEKRLEDLEKQRNIDKNEGQVITISRESWENLMSRVLLLETKLELKNIELHV